MFTAICCGLYIYFIRRITDYSWTACGFKCAMAGYLTNLIIGGSQTNFIQMDIVFQQNNSVE
jgi:hypothetical protein